MTDLSQRLHDALVGRYRIERTLGAGGMATVYVAEDLRHHRQVALKLMGELQEARGDRVKAAEYYRRHIELLKNADPQVAAGLGSVREALRRVTDEPVRR